ncbi:MAG: PBP1A family penicillin-binding protein [Firmicutes bacterium]|nr:PBP1A family penicillin-binding protein [Alicyclobacillaceae bacterium]MCL6496174.1 PBP1A family penicillin-binding protein [Bacillota bacterium]
MRDRAVSHTRRGRRVGGAGGRPPPFQGEAIPVDDQSGRTRQKGSGIFALGRRLWDTAAAASLPVLVLAAVLWLAPTAVTLPVPTLPADTQVFDRSGHLIALLYQNQNRLPIAGDQIPAVMQNAIVAVEDDTFWVEPTVDPVGILRAAVVDLVHRQILQGGSTLTQQLAKNLYLSNRRTLGRKLKELLLAVKLSTVYSKRQILTMYLNDVYFGEGAWGVEAASETYFGHPAQDLTLPQAALLAGLVSAPSYYDPLVHPNAARLRRNLVLKTMANLHYLTPAQARAAAQAPLELNPKGPIATEAPYFVAYVQSQLPHLAPEVARTLYTGGWRITTTLSATAQRAADQAVANWAPPTHLVDGVPEPEVALVALDPKTGAIEAMVGGDDYALTTLNRATDAARPPGSAMKFFLYTTVINDGYPTASVKVSAPVRFPNGHGGYYVPHNFGDVYNGPLTIRRAIALSDNIVALKWMQTVTPAAMIRMAHAMGITSPLADNLTTALGSSSVTPLEMARGVATLANGGFRVDPYAISQIANAQGQVVYTGAAHRVRVLSPQVAYIVTNLFSAPLLNPKGTAHDLEAIIHRPAAAKTGTSSQQRDAWLVGYTPDLAAAVWVGNDNDTPLGLTGDLGAGPIWAHFLAGALAGVPPTGFPVPPNIVTRRVCVRTGLLANGCCTAVREVFIRGHTPRQVSPGCGLGGGGTNGAAPPTPSPIIPPPTFGGGWLPPWLRQWL